MPIKQTIKCMLSTVDNPYNPFLHFDQWLSYDLEKGYNSNQLLARIVVSAPDLEELDEFVAIESAIDDLLENDPIGIFIKVKEDSFVTNREANV